MKEIEGFINGIQNVNLSRLILAFFIIIIAIIINKLVISKLFLFLIKIVNKTHTHIDDNIIKASEKPIKLVILSYGLYYAFMYIGLDGFSLDHITTGKILRIAIIVAICYFLYNLTLENSLIYKKLNKNKRENTIIFPFISIIIRLVIIIVGIVIIANEFGFTGFIAGLGISGIAFALAAQDTFSNLFGGIVIVLDKPFAIGDWIQTSNVEGIIEEITFRSTKIRTFSMALATVPNSKLANESIINWTQRDMRRIHFKFTVKYNTPMESIRKCVKRIEDMLKETDEVRKDIIIVSFNELTAYGFGIFVYFYTEMMDYVSYEKLKQYINLKILEILEDEKIQLTFFLFNLNGADKTSNYTEGWCSEIESIKKITEEEIGG